MEYFAFGAKIKSIMLTDNYFSGVNSGQVVNKPDLITLSPNFQLKKKIYCSNWYNTD